MPTTVAGDTFVDADATLLQSHTATGPNGGGTYTKHAAAAGSDLAIDGTNSRLRGSAGASGAGTVGWYTHSVVPASADYDVLADLVILNNTAGKFGALLGRWDPSSVSGYSVYYENGTVGLTRYGGAGTASLGTYSAGAITGTHALTLSMAGTTITVLLDGVSVISVTETSITSANRGGARLGYVPTQVFTGVHLDNWALAEDVTATKSGSDTGTGTEGTSTILAQVGPHPSSRSLVGSASNVTAGKITGTWTGFPGAVRCANGDLLIATPDGNNELAFPYTTAFLRSIDSGATWTNEGTNGWIADTSVFWFTLLANGDLLLTGVALRVPTDGHFWTYLARSTDHGHTWTTPTIISYGTLGTDNYRIAYSGPLEATNGDLMASFARNKASGDIDTIAARSTDSGATWTQMAVVASTASWWYDEPVIVRLADGRLACFMRTSAPPQTANTDLRIYTSLSSDDGYTWSTPTEAFRQAGGRPIVTVAPDGAVICAYRDHPVSTAAGVTYLRQSLDNCVTWSSAVQIGTTGYVSTYGQPIITNPAGGGTSDVTIVFGEQNTTTAGRIMAYKLSGVNIAEDTGTVTEGLVTVGVGTVSLSGTDSATGTEASGVSILSSTAKSATDTGTSDVVMLIQTDPTHVNAFTGDTGTGTESSSVALVVSPTNPGELTVFDQAHTELVLMDEPYATVTLHDAPADD